ncbi:hypothetical protein GOP47_0024716 [Adiantum capillus-veneris]|uniref:Uncharacterized protein n=1 Tax=Adiantum capillus-veneris TaxID=13818 RepID=A0A9D4Z5A6_ADICA|nr:hypothetical protein GOP47_0024716 [Adiantum capillus-veneris]
MMQIRGSKSSDTSPKSNKCSAKKAKEVVKHPYELYKPKQGEGSWVTKEILDAHDAVIIKGRFNTMEGYRATLVMLSDSFFRMQYKPEYKVIFRRLGLENYFSLQPWGVDIQRSWELLTSIDDDGVALLTDLDGNRVKVTITEELIQEALKLNKGEKDLDQMHSAKEREEVFVNIQGQSYTFQSMVCQDVVAPLRIHMQHFKLLKPERHTKPDAKLAHPYTKAHTANTGLSYNFIKSILNDIKQLKKGANFQRNYHLAGGHMLTRIAYHALGIIDELPPVITASASSLMWPGNLDSVPSQPERQLSGRQEMYEESEDGNEDDNDEENEDGEDQEGNNEGIGKSMSEGEMEPLSSLSNAILSKDPSLDEIYKFEEIMRLERAYYIARKKRKGNEGLMNLESASKEKRTKQKEDPQFIEKLDRDTDDPQEQLQVKKNEELSSARPSSQSKEQEGEPPNVKGDKMNHPQGDAAENKENFKEDQSAIGTDRAGNEVTSDQDRKYTIELLHFFSNVTSQGTPQIKACLGLTGQSGSGTHAEALLETKNDEELSFAPVASPQRSQETMQIAKEVSKEKGSEEGKEGCSKDQQRTEEPIGVEGDQQQIHSEQEERVDDVKTLCVFQSSANASDSDTSTAMERKVPLKEWVRGRALTFTQTPQEIAKASTEEKKEEWKTKKEAEELQIKPDGWEKMYEKEKTEARTVVSTPQTGEVQVLLEKGETSAPSGENPSAQSDERALDKGSMEQSISCETGLGTLSISQIPSQGISSCMLDLPVDTLQMVTISTNDCEEMLDNIVGLLQRYKTKTKVFKKYSAMLAAQEQLTERLRVEKEDLAAKYRAMVDSLSVAEAQLEELQAKYQEEEKQRQLYQLNFNKLVTVHYATLERLENANKVLDQLAHYPLSFVTNKEAEESAAVRSLREHSIELANLLDTERMMRSTLASAFKQKEQEMQRKIDSLEEELLVKKLKLQSEQSCRAFQLGQEKSKEEKVKNFSIDLNLLDSGEASTTRVELQPIYISSEGSRKEEM